MIEAQITVHIKHLRGPRLERPDHVAAWICADGQFPTGKMNGFTFEVCPEHPNPEDCFIDCESPASVYSASIVTVDEAHEA